MGNFASLNHRYSHAETDVSVLSAIDGIQAASLTHLPYELKDQIVVTAYYTQLRRLTNRWR